MNQIDNDKLGALVGKMLGDLGGAFSVPTVRIGFRTGLHDCLYRHGPARITDLASRTGLPSATCANGHSRKPLTAMSTSTPSKNGSA